MWEGLAPTCPLSTVHMDPNLHQNWIFPQKFHLLCKTKTEGSIQLWNSTRTTPTAPNLLGLFFHHAQRPGCKETKSRNQLCSATTVTAGIPTSAAGAAGGGAPQSSKPTSADGAISHVARLAGTAVSLDGVGADGVFVTVVLSAATVVMLCRVGENKRCVFTRGTAGLAADVRWNSPTRTAVTSQALWITPPLIPACGRGPRQAWDTEELPLWIYCLSPTLHWYLSLRGWPSPTHGADKIYTGELSLWPTLLYIHCF